MMAESSRICLAATLGLLLQVTSLVSVFPQDKVNRDYYTGPEFADFRNNALFAEVIDFERIDYARINALVFFLTNELRKRNHLATLEYARELEQSANMHAHDMVRDDFFSHINTIQPEKKTPNDRAVLCGVSNPYLAENIIEGFGLRYKSNETAYLRGKGKFSRSQDGELIKAHTYLSFSESLVAGWLHSKDHRQNMLSKDALQLGCGIAYFVDSGFNDMPSFIGVQNFQLYQRIVPAKR